jgi:DNA-binding GntR family transcriptional regulator
MNKIELTTAHKEVAALISKMINNGELRKGEKVNEMRLCDLLGVSRTPIREALRTLNTQGLIDLVPHRGAFVSQFSTDEINDMFDVMSMLEGMCARLATQKMSNANFKKIEEFHQKLEDKYSAKDHKAYLEINSQYHSFIQEIAENKTLNEVVNGIRQKILLYRHKQLYEHKRFDHSIQEHRDLLEAFRKRDSKKAEKMMKRHLARQGKALVGLHAKNNPNNRKSEAF